VDNAIWAGDSIVHADKEAASAPASLSAWTMLSPAQIAYASRYLESMENERD